MTIICHVKSGKITRLNLVSVELGVSYNQLMLTLMSILTAHNYQLAKPA